jgi:hypothetical protein
MDYQDYEKRSGGIPDNTENDKFIKMVRENPPMTFTFSVIKVCGRPQIVFMDAKTGERVCDAICHWGSYGHEEGLIEVMGYPLYDADEADEDDVEGFLTADTVYARLMNADKERIPSYTRED